MLILPMSFPTLTTHSNCFAWTSFRSIQSRHTLPQGSALDLQTVIDCWPMLLVGILLFLLIEFGVIYSEGGALSLLRADAARMGLLLAGGENLPLSSSTLPCRTA
jgi:hypothetical protein